MRNWKKPTAIVVIILTFVAFGYYIIKHPATVTSLKHLNPLLILLLLGLYLLTIFILALILHVSLMMCGKQINVKENILLTIYSTIVNFFGPLQSGPGVRAIYLKKKHAVKFNSFLYVTMIYYAFFAIISGGFVIISKINPAYLLLLALIAIPFFILLSKKLRTRLKVSTDLNIKLSLYTKLFLLTLSQLLVVALIYFIELHSINHSISLRQAIVYTGVADFALFISLTPGALGFREAFLVFSKNLHHISTSNILSASVIDRGIYILLLGLLFLGALSIHAKDRLEIKKYSEK